MIYTQRRPAPVVPLPVAPPRPGAPQVGALARAASPMGLHPLLMQLLAQRRGTLRP